MPVGMTMGVAVVVGMAMTMTEQGPGGCIDQAVGKARADPHTCQCQPGGEQ